MIDEKQVALQELHNLMVRTVAMMDSMEALEHRVATVIEGGRQQISHLVSDLQLPEMRAELRAIKGEMQKLAKRLT